MTSVVRAELLEKRHVRTQFACGEESLDTWLKQYARQSADKDGSRTYVVCHEGAEVVGYYSLCSFSVREDPPPVRIGHPDIPAILLARLAVDESQQGTGLGGQLLLDALVRSVAIADGLGAALLVVHALHDRAAAFYKKHGFRPFDSDPLQLYLPMKDIRRTLKEAGIA